MKLNLASRNGDGNPADNSRGWVKVDLEDCDIVLDLSAFPWPWDDSSVDAIVADHIVEHFDKPVAYQFLRECERILKPGSPIHMAAPDMDRFIHGRITGNWSLTGGKPEWGFDQFFGGPLWEDGEIPPGAHRYMYCEEVLLWMLVSCGFVSPHRVPFDEELDTKLHEPVSMYVEARKAA